MSAIFAETSHVKRELENAPSTGRLRGFPVFVPAFQFTGQLSYNGVCFTQRSHVVQLCDLPSEARPFS